LLTASGALMATGLASCGSSGSPSASGATACNIGSSTLPLIPQSDRSPAGTWGSAPSVTVPTDSPPTQLECAQLISGSGPKAQDGDSMTMQYVLASYATGQTVIQSSWTSAPFTFTLGETSLIPGWVTGVTGMQAGSRRELLIPSSLGYGSDPPDGSGIPPNDTLVFVLDLQKLN
jgi:peptidylprolyl isomerase